ncbi:3-mercaptopyruvate sulfurtransferase : Marine sediment metagenome DNA, contig: S01H1_S18985 (Fragment) OS=marine sediment metagenome GN=S01H1_52237 PE=4 SV=1: Rhodanese: Rhodanese [Gemmataceae bacterium]
MTRFAALATAALLASAGGGQAGEYPRPDLLVEPAALAGPDAPKGFVILDARTRAKYEAGHVPGARWVDHAEWAAGFGDGRDAAAWSERIGGLGLTADSRVVVYDDNQSKDAARIWWVLRYWGVGDARLLNGGWVGWEKGKYPTEKAEGKFASGEFKAVAAPARLATKDLLLKSLTGDKLQIVDARSEGEFCGTDAMKNKRAGAIPGAKQLEWSDLIEKDSHRFRSPAELEKLFAAAGIELDRPTATHCQSGGRAAVMAYGLELMGAKDVRNYYKSWSEWGNADDTPVVKPGPKKK